MSRVSIRLRRLLAQTKIPKQAAIAVFFSIIMLTSMAAPAYAAGSGDSTEESLSSGSLDDAVQSFGTEESQTDIRHSEISTSTTGLNDSYAESIIIEQDPNESLEPDDVFEVSVEDEFTVKNTDTGSEVLVSFDQDEFDSVNVTHVDFTDLYTPAGELNTEFAIEVGVINGDEDVEPQSYNASAEPTEAEEDFAFIDETFSNYSVEYTSSNSNESTSTDDRLIGIGYESPFESFVIDDETDEINVSIPRDPGVDESWYTEYVVRETDADSGIEDQDIVENDANDDSFNFTVNVSDLSVGEYSLSLRLAVDDPNESDEDVPASNQILSISSNFITSFSSENVSVYDRSPQPLRVDTATAATEIETPNPDLRVAGEGKDTLNKPEVGVFNIDDEVNFEFRERDSALTSDEYENGTETQFVTARVDEMPDDFDELVNLATLQSPTADEYTVEDAAPIDDDGAMDHTTSFNQPGYYITYVVAVKDGDGFRTTGGSSLTVDGNVEVAGMDMVAVQTGEAAITPPTEVQRGEDVSVDVGSETDDTDADGDLNHLLVAYHEDTFTSQEVEFISDTEDLSTLSEDNISIETSLGYVNGVGNFDADVSVFGLSAGSDSSFNGQISVGSVFNELVNQTSLEQIENESTDDNVLDISATSTAGLDDGTISVETLSDWKTGEYRLVYVAQEDGEVRNFATVDDTVEIIDEPLEADIQADPTTADVNETEVEFDASGTQGSVNEYRWDFTGDGEFIEGDATETYTYTVSELGEYEPTVSVVGPDGDVDNASTTVTVEDTIPPVAELDLIYEGDSIVDGVVGVGERFTADASDSTDNHRLEDSYRWEITDGDGDVVADDDTREDETSFRLDEAGDYTAEVTVVDESGNENSTTADFEVVDESVLSADIDADDEQRLQDGLNATVDVTNVGSTETEDDFDWTLTATGEQFDGGEITRTFSGSGSSLNVSETESFNEFDDELTAWAQAADNRTVGDVDLEFDISADTRTSNDSTTVDVTYSNLEADAVARNGIEGTDIRLRSFIENNGTAAADDSTATVTVENSSEDEVYREEVTVSELGAGDTLRDRNRTTFDEADDYTLNVTVEDALFPENNSAEADFTVHPYSLDVESTTAPDTVESGDSFLLRMTYSTNASEPVDATLNVSETDGISHANESSDDLRERSPSAGSNDTVTWRVRADEFVEDGYDLEFSVDSAVEGIDESDSETVSIDSERQTETRTEENSTVLNEGENTTSTELNFYNDSASVDHTNVSITLQGGSDGRTLQGLEYLVRYPYGCVEQTTSAFLGALNTDQYYRLDDNYNISDDRQDRINDSIAEGVEALGSDGDRAQLESGGWNMWGQDARDGETFFSMYATYGLSEVENDEIHGELNEDELDNTDFDNAVTWMQGDQNDNGSFDARWYIDDEPATTGFAMVSLAQANETYDNSEGRITADTQDNITQVYGNASEYLVDVQDADDGYWTDDDGQASDKSTALAVWGLQIAYDANASQESDEIDQDDIQEAIDAGADWLAEEQEDDGSWSSYHNNPSWNDVGDKSETTAYATLALDAADKQTGDDEAIENATTYLTETYETRGSWGYPRATAVSLEALIQTTDGTADRTVDVTFSNSTSDVTIEDLEVTSDEPDITEELSSENKTELRGLLDSTEGTVSVTVDEKETSTDGTVIIGLENTQEVDLDVLEGGDN